MANEDSKNFSYMDIMQNPVMTGKAIGNIWIGFPDVKYLDNDIVIIDDVQRKELIRRIIELEKYTRNVRNTKKGFKQDARVDAERLFVSLFENDYMNPDALAIAWIKTYQDIRKENSKEYFKIPQEARRNMDILEKSMDGKAVFLEIYDEESCRYKVDGIWSLGYEKKHINSKNQRNLSRLANYMGQFYSDEDKMQDENLTNDLINILNSNFTLQELLLFLVKDEDCNLGHIIINSTYDNALLLQGYTPSQIEELTNEESNDLVSSGEKRDEFTEEYRKLKLDVILEYLDYIDLDKYFISYAFKEFIYFDNMGNYPFNKEVEDEKSVFEIIDIDDVFQRMEFLVRFLSEADRRGLINKSAEQTFYIGDKSLKINYADIKEKLNCFSGMVYLTPKTYEAMRPFLYNRDDNIWNTTDNYSYLRDLQISDTDKKFLMTIDCRNTFDLYKAGLIDKKFIIETIKEMKSPSFIKEYNETIESMNISFDDEETLKSYQVLYPSEIMNYLYDKDILLDDDVKTLYEEDVFDIEKLNSTGISEETIKNFVSDEELIEAYKNYVKALLIYRNSETPENKDALSKTLFLKNKRMAIYRKYKLDKMSKEEQTENAEKLILDYYVDLDLESKEDDISEALREMYKDRIVNFEAIRNSDPKFLQDLLINVMLKRGELTLDDTVKLKKSFEFEEQKLIVEEALKDDSISENEKFILVMNMFFENTKDDTLARYEFLKRFRATQYVGELDPMYATTEVEQEKGQNNDSTKSGKQTGKEHVYPDNIKWMLFMSIDKDAMATRYDNGYVEFYLPKFDVRAIEKYYTIRENKIQGPAYGVATCIMSDETYRAKNESFVKTNDSGGVEINERNLRKIVPQKDRVVHITKSVSKNWMRGLVQKLGIDLENDTRYTKQELESLNKVIENYENCYERY